MIGLLAEACSDIWTINSGKKYWLRTRKCCFIIGLDVQSHSTCA